MRIPKAQTVRVSPCSWSQIQLLAAAQAQRAGHVKVGHWVVDCYSTTRSTGHFQGTWVIFTSRESRGRQRGRARGSRRKEQPCSLRWVHDLSDKCHGSSSGERQTEPDHKPRTTGRSGRGRSYLEDGSSRLRGLPHDGPGHS